MVKALILIICLTLTPGCGVALLTAAAGYTVSKIGEKNTAKDKAYGEYYTSMQRVNLDREAKGLAPQPIMTQSQWAAEK